MKNEQALHIDTLVYRRVRVFWLYFGFIFSIMFVFSSEFWHNTIPLLNFCLIAYVISVIAAFLLMLKADIQSRYSLAIGWAHACSFLYISLCLAIWALGIIDFIIDTIPNQRIFYIHYIHDLNQLIVAMAKGLALYFISVTVLYITCRDKKNLAIPPVEFHIILFLFLCLALRLILMSCYL